MSTPLSGPLARPPADWNVDLAADPVGAQDPVDVPRRGWFRWSATELPVAPLLLLGMLLGPQGLFILTPAALAAIDPALPVALATLGGLVGLMPGLQGPLRRAIGTAAVTSLVTVLFVAAGFTVGGILTGEQTPGVVWLFPLVLGISAASSLAVPAHRVVNPLAPSTASTEAEALVSVVAGGLLLAFVRQGTVIGTVLWVSQACAVVAALSIAGFLMLRRSVADAERRVFAVATLLLVGGAADSLSFSALLGGICAGLLWKAGGGQSRDSLQRDMLYAIPPLLALVLVVAGARVELTTTSVGLAAAYAFLRTIGRVTAGTLATRIHPGVLSEGRLSLLSPGVFGIAFALNAFRALGSDLSIAVSVVVMGTILSDVTALLVTPRRGQS